MNEISFQAKFSKNELLTKVSAAIMVLQKKAAEEAQSLLDGAESYKQQMEQIDKDWALWSFWQQITKHKPEPKNCVWLSDAEALLATQLRHYLELGEDGRQKAIAMLPLGIKKVTMDDGTGVSVTFGVNEHLRGMKSILEDLRGLDSFVKILRDTSSEDIYVDSKDLEQLQKYVST